MGRLVTSAVAVALACAGCTSEAPGQPLPAPADPSTRPPASTSEGDGAPPINSPGLDLASYVNRVCDLLMSAQLAPFAIKAPGKPDDGPTGRACVWNPPDTSAGARVRVQILSKVGYGWDGLYARKDRWAKFESAGEVNGYPAVHLLATTIDEETGGCLTAAGVNRDLLLEVGVDVNVRSSAEYKKPCSVSDRVAGLVIDTLKGGR